MVEPTIIYVFRGQVERLNLGRRRNPWKDGYSENGQHGGEVFPWMTYRECQADAKARGCKAVFIRQGARGVVTEG